MICPFCENEIKPSKHIYTCMKKEISIDKIERKFLYLKYNYPEISDKEILSESYIDNLMSLPDIKKLYNIDYKSIQFLLKYYKIDIRSIKESNNMQKTRDKYKKTCLEKYGYDNVSKIPHIKKTKSETLIENYGVDNFFKSDIFSNNIDNYYYSKYNMSLKEYKSIKGKEVWENLSDDEKNLWLIKSMHSDIGKINSQNNRTEYSISNIELRIKICLEILNFDYQSQYKINHNNGIYFYDFLLKEVNIIIEVNGDYWHANPLLYDDDNTIKYFRMGEVFPSTIWERDKLKENTAKENGFKFITIWENDIKNLNDDDILLFTLGKIKEMGI